MITDLVQIRRLGEKKHAENEKFRKHLKTRAWAEKPLRRAALEIQEEMNCRKCAECCRVTEVEPTRRDIEKLSKFLGITGREFIATYTMIAEDKSRILKRTEKKGCVFLSGNDCTVYEARPVDCSGFPHLVKGSASIPAKMWAFVERAEFCPIVYNWMEAAKELTKFKK
jgi:uncharacterized protein